MGGGCGETEGDITAVQQQALLLYKTFTLTIHYYIPTKFCTAVIKNSTVIKYSTVNHTSTIMCILYSACCCNNVPVPPVSPPLPSSLCLSPSLPVQCWGLRGGPARACYCLQCWGRLLQYCCFAPAVGTNTVHRAPAPVAGFDDGL